MKLDRARFTRDVGTNRHPDRRHPEPEEASRRSLKVVQRVVQATKRPPAESPSGVI
jgi:hypothetical protein